MFKKLLFGVATSALLLGLGASSQLEAATPMRGMHSTPQNRQQMHPQMHQQMRTPVRSGGTVAGNHQMRMPNPHMNPGFGPFRPF